MMRKASERGIIRESETGLIFVEFSCMTVLPSRGKIRKNDDDCGWWRTLRFQFVWGSFFALFFWAVGLLVMYMVIYLAVKHAINNAQTLRELREEIRALRMSGSPRNPDFGPAGPGWHDDRR